MINPQMRTYNFYRYGEVNAYGQPTLATSSSGTIKIAINLLSQQVPESLPYSAATYLGITLDDADDNMVIAFGAEKLKVLYVNSFGRFNQVWMARL